MSLKRIEKLASDSVFGENLIKYVEFCSWARWNPDLFLDLIKPENGGINLHADQRILLRCIMRFVALYGVFPRGYSKTYIEEVAMYLCSIFYPGIDLAMTAQTKENAAALIEDKHNEIMRHFPLLKNEVDGNPTFSKGNAKIKWKSEAQIDNLANAQSSKGQRRKRIVVEESALLNDTLFQDVIKPIVEVPRNTVGPLSIVDPCELNQQINFFTTSGYRGSDEYRRNLKMYEDMINLKGEITLGSSWFLACWYGRGSSKSQILKKKADMSATSFAQNYESKWVGCSDSALVNINKLMDCRNLPATQKTAKQDEEFYVGVDVARSQKASNNQSSAAVVKVVRNKERTKILSYEVVNIIHISNILNFTAQACAVKKIQKRYNAKVVVMDGNGLGAGLIDECLKENVDPSTGENFICWDTINDDNIPEVPEDADKILFNLKAQSYQSRIVTNFIDIVDSGKLRLLANKQLSDFSFSEQDDFDNAVAPFLETDCLFEEVANLKLKMLPNGGVTIEKVIRKLDKDRVSALIYVLWYINEYCRDERNSSDYDYEVFVD